jgi:hypothetical protein
MNFDIDEILMLHSICDLHRQESMPYNKIRHPGKAYVSIFGGTKYIPAAGVLRPAG